MIDFASCLTEYAVQVSETCCSAYSKNSSCISTNLTPPIQNAVTCIYRIVLSTQKQILITLTWCKNSLFQGLNIFFGKDPSSSIKLNTNSPRLFRKLKGSKSIEYDGRKIELFWDLSTARYLTGPEPVDGYYVFITVDSELGLILGDVAEEAARKKIKTPCNKMAKSSIITRQEHYLGNTLYSTKAQFCETGNSHEISIRCSGEAEGLKYPALSVSIDKKMVINVKRLQWNFRGNQTIFLDGLLIDLMWDVHDWFYNPGSGCGVFMFRTRSGFDNSRLWLQEKMTHKDEDGIEFSLMIYACKISFSTRLKDSA